MWVAIFSICLSSWSWLSWCWILSLAWCWMLLLSSETLTKPGRTTLRGGALYAAWRGTSLRQSKSWIIIGARDGSSTSLRSTIFGATCTSSWWWQRSRTRSATDWKCMWRSRLRTMKLTSSPQEMRSLSPSTRWSKPIDSLLKPQYSWLRHFS